LGEFPDEGRPDVLARGPVWAANQPATPRLAFSKAVHLPPDELD
jgi:hypothetical protein